MPSTLCVPMTMAGMAAAAAAVNIAALEDEGLLIGWSLPLTCFAGSVLGGLLAVIMAPPNRQKTMRSEGLLWLGSTVTAVLFGPAICQFLPKIGFVINADNVLGVAGVIGFLAWPLMAAVQSYGPARLREWLSSKSTLPANKPADNEEEGTK
jgi:hypothetical protein